MKSEIAQKISDSLIAWRDAECEHLIEFNDSIDTKQFEKYVKEVASEIVNHKAADTNLGARIVIVTFKRKESIEKLATAVLQHLQGIAFDDEKVFDYIEKWRVKAPTREDECFTVEILRQVQKREVWL